MGKQSEYWRAREKAALEQNEKREKSDYDRQLAEIYQQMMDDCDADIQKFYARYAKKEGITLAEAKKRADNLDIEAYGRKAERYVRDKDFSKEANEEMRLYNMTMKANRLELLKSELSLEMTSGNDKFQKMMARILPERTKDSYERQAGVLGMSIPDAETYGSMVDSIVNGSFHNATWSQRVWANQEALRSQVNTLLVRGLVGGKNPRVLARDLEKSIGAGLKNAERLMRTELARVQIGAQEQAISDAGYSSYKFLAVGSACEDCLALDGKTFKLDKMVPGENAPPMHPNCRCSVCAAMSDEEFKELTGVDPAKLDENGNVVEEKPKDTFVPAKSVKEAEKSAEKYFESEFMDRTFKGKASYTGISLEHANQINRTLEELTEKYPDAKKIAGIKSINPSSAKGKKIFTSEDAVMAYDPIQHGVYINRKVLKDSASLAKYNADSSEAWDIVINNLDKLSGTQRQVAQRYKDAGRALVGDGSVKDYLMHEYGHHVAWEWLDAKTNNALGARMSKYAPKLAGYATASKNEYLAESFVAYNKGELGKIDPEYSKAIKKLKGGNISNTSRNMKPEMVNYSTKNIPTVRLPKDEYAQVMSELNTNLTKEQLKQPIIYKPIGDYVYTVEVHGFDDYRIIGKVPIDEQYE